MKIKAFEKNEVKKVKSKEKAAYKAERAKIKEAYAAQEIGDKSFNILAAITGGILAILFLLIIGFGVKTVITNGSEGKNGTDGEVTVTSTEVNSEVIASDVSNQVMDYIDGYLENLTDEYGNKIELTDEQKTDIKTRMMNEVLQLLEQTDLLSLTDTERDELINTIKDSILENVLKESVLSTYLTEEDYKKISEEISKYTGTGVASEIEKIKKLLEENSSKQSLTDSTQDDNIKSVDGKVDNLANTTSQKDKELEAKINANNSANNSTTKELEAKIAASSGSSTAAIEKASTELTEKLDSLDSKYSVYYSQDVSVSLPSVVGASTTMTWTSDKIVATSKINLVFGSTSGYTVTYTQSAGKVVAVFKVYDASTAPSTLTGTLYIDNSANNSKSN